jgi:hypothetical protein
VPPPAAAQQQHQQQQQLQQEQHEGQLQQEKECQYSSFEEALDATMLRRVMQREINDLRDGLGTLTTFDYEVGMENPLPVKVPVTVIVNVM